MTQSPLQILSDFESALASGKVRGIEDYYATLSPSDRSAELVSDLARAELYFSKWPHDRLLQILSFANHADPGGTAWANIIDGVYIDRVECGEQPSLKDFEGLDLTGCSLRAPVDPLGLGDQCGRFRIVARVGAGAFGVVFEGQSIAGDRVAIKSPFATKIQGHAETARNLLRAEAEAAQKLAGFAFPSFVEWIELENGHPCLATGFIDGANLRDLIRENPLEAKIAAAIVADVADALYFAHSRDLVHRDVKPANIMIRGGRAILLDFGFAVNDEQMASLDGQVAGTLGHQSPDSILGNVSDMDARSDVWSLGPLLHECLTGQSLFNPDGREDALTTAIVAASLPTSDPKVPEDLKVVIQKCVQANPIGRYDTAKEVANALRVFIDPSTPVESVDRTPLFAFRIGRELGEAQCHVDAFDHFVSLAPDDANALHFAIGYLHLVSEKIRHFRIQLARLKLGGQDWPSFDHKPFSIFFYNQSKLTSADIPALTAAASSAMEWLETSCSLVQSALESEPKSTQALFELGLVATLPKSITPRGVRIRKLAELAQLPAKVWQSYEEFLESNTDRSLVNYEWGWFLRRVERHFLYGEGSGDHANFTDPNRPDCQ